MFDNEFFPTPESVLIQMGIDCNNKTVLEPSAGKGDIIDYLNLNGAKQVLACEFNKELSMIVKDKCDTFLGYDFLKVTSEMVSHINMIVMNPPFKNADKHIIHAFKIAPEGCEIIALCNYETINKPLRYREFSNLVSTYGVESNLGNCFSTAERKTNVEIGLVKLHKPVVGFENTSFEGFFMDEEEIQQNGSPGVMPFNEVRALVSRYVGAMKCYDRLDVVKKELEYTTKILGFENYSIGVAYNETVESKEQFSIVLQKKSWSYIFDKMNMQKYVTSGVMKDINKFVNEQQKVPFTEKNIYRMFEIIVGTQQQTFNRALEEAIDNFTKYTHENRFGVEGWKTNSGYMLNKKFIVNGMVRSNYSYPDKMELSYNSNSEYITDLTKVICRITGVNYDDIETLRNVFSSNKGLDRGQWYDYAFFEIKCFKKGTMHLKFKNDEHWYMLNKAYGELKGFVLSEKYK